VIDDGALASVGLDAQRLSGVNPAIVLVEVVGFGFDGPYSRFEMTDYVAYAASAWMAAMGEPGRAPLYPGVDYPFYVAGLYAAYGALVALRHARATGEGQVVRVATLDAAISVDFYETTKYAYRGKLRQRDGHMITGVAASVQPCRDGHIALTFAGESDWRAFTEVIAAPELAEGEFATATLRLLHTDELNRRLQDVLSRLSVDEVVRGSQERHVAVTRVARARDVYASEQLRAREWFATVEHPVAGTVEHPGPPFRLEAPEWRLARPAPQLGEHTAEVLGST
jgi:crotonobetainyl-CoA:carnitine CoA-transferase CaiB-like acyl-CoA transferase